MKSIKILSILTLLFGFSQCGSNTFVKNPTFKVEKAFYNNWVGGQPGVRGTKVEMHLKDASEINFDALYFQGKVTKVEVSMKDGFVQVIGHFSTSKTQKRDVILDLDATKELENKVPNLEKFPFELKENEAMLSYKRENKTVYFKIENIKKVRSIPFPSMNKK
jgi:NADH dehydrogenase/NADH:ubiquinone oxidoreductase subunit G